MSTHHLDDSVQANVQAKVQALVPRLAQALKVRGWSLATAESCTGGLIAAACTAVSGSSDWFDRGFVTYSNASKMQLLGVSEALLATHGAVSEPVVRAMAEGAMAHSSAQVTVAVTGIAGPTGATPGKPVGTVWLAVSVREGPTQAWSLWWPGDRQAVREATVHEALDRLVQVVSLGGRTE
jgi:nicotinamide-nucleotide amidase